MTLELTTTLISVVTSATISITGILLARWFDVRRYGLEFTRRTVENYRDIVGPEGRITEKNYLAYLGILNEELYYVKHGYKIPSYALNDWISNMIDQLPVFTRDGGGHKIINERYLQATGSYFADREHWPVLARYPDIIRLLMVADQSDLVFFDTFPEIFNQVKQIRAEKQHVVAEIRRNLRCSKSFS